MTRSALSLIQALAGLDELPGTDSAWRASVQLTRMPGNVRDRLRISQQVAVRVALHANVPALVVAVIHELFDEHLAMLSRDARHASIVHPTARGAVADRAVLEQLCAMGKVRASANGSRVFLERRGRRQRDALRQSSERDDQLSGVAHSRVPQRIASTAAPRRFPARRRSSASLACASANDSTAGRRSRLAARAMNSSPSARVRLATEDTDRSPQSS